MGIDIGGPSGASPYGTKPTSLPAPVPTQDLSEEAQAMLGSMEVPELSAEAAAMAPPPSGEMPINTGELPVDMQPTVLDESPVERYGRIGNPLQATKEMVGDQLARFRAAWAVTDVEKEGMLRKIYGEKGVRKTEDGTFQIKRPGEKGFRDFDPNTGTFSLDVIGDVLDFSRDAAEGTVELGGRIVGGIGGAMEGAGKGVVVGAPAGPLGSVSGGVTGGMLGAIGGQAIGGGLGALGGLKLGDYIAENLVGIERDPKRDGVKEGAIAAGIGGGAGMVFGVASGALTRMRVARELNKANVTTKDVLQTAKEVEQVAANLNERGINLTQGKMTLSPGQIAGDLSPEARELDKVLTTDGRVRDFFINQGKLVHNGWNKLIDGVSNITGKPAEELFQTVKGTAKYSREMEGKLIGSYRDMAMKASGNMPRVMPRTSQMSQQFAAFKDMSLKELQERFPDASPAVLGKVKFLVTDLDKTMAKHKGELPLSEVDRLYTNFKSTVDNFWGTKSGGDVARELLTLKDAMRDDWADHIGATLQRFDPEALPSYLASMKKYSDIMTAQKTLRGVLKRNDMSSAAFADQIFSQANGKDRVAQLKVLIDDADPDLWPQLVKQKMDLITENAKRGSKEGRIDWRVVDKEIANLDKAEVLDQMLGSPQAKKDFQDFLSVARRIDNTYDFKSAQIKSSGFLGSIRNLALLAANQVSAVARVGAGQNLAQGIIDGIGKDQALKHWLQGEGLELVMKGIPKKEHGRVRKALMGLIEGGTAVGMAGGRRDLAVPLSLQSNEEYERAPQ